MTDLLVVCDQCDRLPVVQIWDMDEGNHFPPGTSTGTAAGGDRWYLFRASAWGHGRYGFGGLATSYDMPGGADPLSRSRSHVGDVGQLLLICANQRKGARCLNRAEVSRERWQRVCDRLAEHDQQTVTIAGFRAAAGLIVP